MEDKGLTIERHDAAKNQWQPANGINYSSLRHALAAVEHLAQFAERAGVPVCYRITNERGAKLWPNEPSK